MSLDVAAMRALVGEANLSLESARLILDETGARAEDIEAVELRPLWAVLEARVRNRQPIDAVGVREALRSNGSPRLQESLMTVLLEPELGVTRERLGLLRDAGVRRRLVDALREVAQATQRGRPLAEVDSLLRAAPALLHGAGSRVRNARGDALAMLDHLEAAWTGKAVPHLRTGLGELDDVLGGLINNLIVIGARTGVGKSALVAGLVRNWVRAGVKVGVLAYEDDARDMEARIIACEAGVSVKHARGDLLPNEHQRTAIATAIEWWSKREHLLEVDDARPSGSAADVVASMRTMVARGCRVALLDNMTCVRLDQVNDKRHDLIVEAALRDIRDEAQGLHFPAIVVGHLKRGQTESDESQRPPKLSDFSNATAWENYARVALGMWHTPEGVGLRVLKQTNGPAGADFDIDFEHAAAVVTGARHRVASPRPPSERGPQRYTRTRAWQDGGDE